VTGRTGKAEHNEKTEKDRQNRNRISTLGLRKKREFTLFFFRARRFRFFSRSFFFALSRSFFALRSRARKREKSAGAHLWYPCLHGFGIPQMENGNFRLFAANKKWKQQTSVCLLRTETENGSLISVVG
jgi:hypothetical protein